MCSETLVGSNETGESLEGQVANAREIRHQIRHGPGGRHRGRCFTDMRRWRLFNIPQRGRNRVGRASQQDQGDKLYKKCSSAACKRHRTHRSEVSNLPDVFQSIYSKKCESASQGDAVCHQKVVWFATRHWRSGYRVQRQNLISNMHPSFVDHPRLAPLHSLLTSKCPIRKPAMRHFTQEDHQMVHQKQCSHGICTFPQVSAFQMTLESPLSELWLRFYKQTTRLTSTW